MNGDFCTINHNVNNLKNILNSEYNLAVKNLLIGRQPSLEAAIIYIDNELVNKDILNSVMSNISEEIPENVSDIEEYICSKHLKEYTTHIETNIKKASDKIKSGYSVLLLHGCWNFIIIDTYNSKSKIPYTIKNIKQQLGMQSSLVVRNFSIGRGLSIAAALIYINGFTNKDIIDRDILNPLMLNFHEENLDITQNIDNLIYEKYIAVSNTSIETDINIAIEAIKRGKTVLLIESSNNYIVVDTSGGIYRAISEPVNDISLRGPREGFGENLETNISILSRKIKDKNLTTEKFTLGRRSQTDLVIMYIKDIVDDVFLQKLKANVNKIDMDLVEANGIIEQCLDEHPYSVFPQTNGSERPDVIAAALMEGRVAFLLSGTPYVTTYPSVFVEYFQTIEDYYGRTSQAIFIRILRMIAVFIVLFFPPIYITFIKYNAELIPIVFIKSLINSRRGIALTPFMSLLTMKLSIDLLREGGLRLPSKIGQTLSVVGGIIIGDAALQAKIVSSSTLLVAGVATVASFVISNYQMATAINITSYITIAMANWLGMLGIIVSGFFLLAYLCSLENYGVPYFEFHKSDMKDTLLRAPVWKMKKRPIAIPNKNPIRQSNFRSGKNE